MIKAETTEIREDSLEKEAVDSSQLAECMTERGGGRTYPAGLVLGLCRPVEGQGFAPSLILIPSPLRINPPELLLPHP